MPRGQPFTQLCQQLAALGRGPADLHTHTMASDGDLTPSQLVIRAWQARLSALAVTDHDTVAGVAEAVATAKTLPSRALAVVPGVEISTEHEGREYHVVGLFIRPDAPELLSCLAQIRERRTARFHHILNVLAERGTSIPPHLTAGVTAVSESLGRRHVATLLVRAGRAKTRSDAFRRFLDPIREQIRIPHSVPIAEAIRCVGSAGGLASLAHPPPDFTEARLAAFAEFGLAGVEVRFPSVGAARSGELRTWADRIGLLSTGGSDYHGPDGPRSVGTPALPFADFERLAEYAGRDTSSAAVTSVGRARLRG